MVREKDAKIRVVEKGSERSQESFVDCDGCSSQAARKMVKKLIVRRSLSEVERIGLLSIAVTVVVLLVNCREKTLARLVECVIVFLFLIFCWRDWLVC